MSSAEDDPRVLQTLINMARRGDELTPAHTLILYRRPGAGISRAMIRKGIKDKKARLARKQASNQSQAGPSNPATATGASGSGTSGPPAGPQTGPSRAAASGPPAASAKPAVPIAPEATAKPAPSTQAGPAGPAASTSAAGAQPAGSVKAGSALADSVADFARLALNPSAHDAVLAVNMQGQHASQAAEQQRAGHTPTFRLTWTKTRPQGTSRKVVGTSKTQRPANPEDPAGARPKKGGAVIGSRWAPGAMESGPAVNSAQFFCGEEGALKELAKQAGEKNAAEAAAAQPSNESRERGLPQEGQASNEAGASEQASQRGSRNRPNVVSGMSKSTRSKWPRTLTSKEEVEPRSASGQKTTSRQRWAMRGRWRGRSSRTCVMKSMRKMLGSEFRWSSSFSIPRGSWTICCGLQCPRARSADLEYFPLTRASASLGLLCTHSPMSRNSSRRWYRVHSRITSGLRNAVWRTRCPN